MIHEKSSPNIDMVIPAVTLEDQSTAGDHSDNNTLDDIFGDDTHSQAPPTEPSEIPRVRNTHVTNGYRDGISESKARFVQQGFDEGYSLGAELGLKAGWVLGVAESLVKALGQRRLSRRRVPYSTTASGLSAEEPEKDQSRLLEQREKLERKRGNMLIEAQEVLATARRELIVPNLFGREYFGEDGIWTYAVPGKEEDVMLREVVNAHPLIYKWTKVIRGLATSWHVDLNAAAKATESSKDG